MFENCTGLDVPVTLRNLNRVTNVSHLLDGCVEFKSELKIKFSTDFDQPVNVDGMFTNTPLLANDDARATMREYCVHLHITFVPDTVETTRTTLQGFLNLYNKFTRAPQVDNTDYMEE